MDRATRKLRDMKNYYRAIIILALCAQAMAAENKKSLGHVRKRSESNIRFTEQGTIHQQPNLMNQGHAHKRLMCAGSRKAKVCCCCGFAACAVIGFVAVKTVYSLADIISSHH